MSVATDWPARTDSNGRTWWRPVRDPKMSFDQWGWTSDAAQAHPDYDALNTCTCFVTDPSTWFYYGSAVEPGSQMEPNPCCPLHFSPRGPHMVICSNGERGYCGGPGVCKPCTDERDAEQPAADAGELVLW